VTGAVSAGKNDPRETVISRDAISSSMCESSAWDE